MSKCRPVQQCNFFIAEDYLILFAFFSQDLDALRVPSNRSLVALTPY